MPSTSRMSCGSGRAADQIVAALDVIAFLDVDHLRLRHQILDDLAAVLGHDPDLALGLVVLAEHDAARDLGDDRVLLGLARLEQLGDARQTAGDVAGLGGFARRHGRARRRPDLLRRPRPRAPRPAPACSAPASLGAVAEQGQARTQILLLGRRAAVLGDDALGDARRLVGLLGHRLAFDQVLTYFTMPGFSVITGMVNGSHSAMRSPLLDDVAIVEQHIRHRKACGGSRARGRPCRRSPSRPNGEATTRRPR